MAKRHYNIDFETIVIAVALLTVGMKNLNGLLPLNLSQIIILFLVFLQLLEMLYFKRFVMHGLSVLLVVFVLLITVVINQNISGDSMKMLFGIFIYSFSFYYYTWKRRNDLKRVLKLVVRISLVLAVVGIIQEIGFLLSIEKLYLFDYIGISNQTTTSGSLMRITSLSTEPAHLGYMLIPGLYVSMLHLFRMDNEKFIKTWQAILIFAAVFLTFSFLAYINVLIIFGFLMLSGKVSLSKKIAAIFTGVLVVLFISSAFSDAVQMVIYKYNSLFTLQQLNTTNLSSFAVDSNFKVAMANVKEHYYLGSGLNTHEEAYFRYIHDFYGQFNIIMYLNYEDAASLFIRVLSEFGVLGLLLFVSFLLRYKIKKRAINSITVQANEMAMIFILGYSLRNGIYINPFLWLLISVYVVSFNIHKKQLKNKEDTSADTKLNLASNE